LVVDSDAMFVPGLSAPAVSDLQFGTLNMDSASSVAGDPLVTESGDANQIESAAVDTAVQLLVAAAAGVPAVGAAADEDSAPLVVDGKGNVLRLKGGAPDAAGSGSGRDAAGSGSGRDAASGPLAPPTRPRARSVGGKRLSVAERFKRVARVMRCDAESTDTESIDTADEEHSLEEKLAAVTEKADELFKEVVRTKAVLNRVVTELKVDDLPEYASTSAHASALAAKISVLVAKRSRGSGKSVDPRRPKPFTGEGDQDQAAAVRRFCNNVSLFLELSEVAPEKWFAHGRLYLEGSASDFMFGAMQSLTASERTWPKFCEHLGSRYGTIDPDTEFWDGLRTLKQGSLTVAEYVHKMCHCFNGITVLPPSEGDKIERFMSGLNAPLKRLVVTAPHGLGANGKWMSVDALMSHAVMQSAGFPDGGSCSCLGCWQWPQALS